MTQRNSLWISTLFAGSHIWPGERGGSVVECRTPEREVRGSKPTAAVLCPWARHFTPRKYWLITQEAMAPSRHDWKIVDWDVKPQHKQTNKSYGLWALPRQYPASRNKYHHWTRGKSPPKVNTKKMYSVSVLKHSKQDSSGVAPLKWDGRTLSDNCEKSNALNRQFQSVFSQRSLQHLSSLAQQKLQELNDQWCNLPFQSSPYSQMLQIQI